MLELSPTASAAPLLPPQGSAAGAARSDDALASEDRAIFAPAGPPSTPPVAAVGQPPEPPLPKAAPDAAAGTAAAKVPPGAARAGAAALPSECALSGSTAVEAVSPTCTAAPPYPTEGSRGADAEAQGVQDAPLALQLRSRSLGQGGGGVESARLIINLTADSSAAWQLPDSCRGDAGHILPRAPAARSEPPSPQVLHVTAVFEIRPARRTEGVSEAQPQAS